MTEFKFEELFQISKDDTEYELLSSEHVSMQKALGRDVLQIKPEALTLLARAAFRDISFYLRTSHLKQLAKILEDPEASFNDRFVAMSLLKNVEIAAKGVLPMCQDTGTAIVVAKKGEQVWTGGEDEASLSRGVYEAYQEHNLRYSQMAPLQMFEEKNTGTNLPVQIEIYAVPGQEYKFLFIAKGGGSANKAYLYQESKALLNEQSFTKFIQEKLKTIGTAACPPYHMVVVVGGTSAEATLKAVKLASTGYYDSLPTTGDEYGRAFRDSKWEEKINLIAQETGIGAQFGGKYLAHDIRVVRLPRHAASCPVGIGLSCSADRQIKAKITAKGIFIEKLDKNPGRFIPDASKLEMAKPVPIDLERPMPEILSQLSKYPVKTRLSLSGTLIVARDVAHAKIKSLLDSGKPMPDYFKKHPVYYAGPAKTPQGMPTGSFGPTTSARMDCYVEEFMGKGGSLIMLGKGNRSEQVTRACKQYGGFYLGSIGGPAAMLAKENIVKVETIDFEDLGMEAVRKIQVKDFPAFIVCDDKGNHFFQAGGSEESSG